MVFVSHASLAKSLAKASTSALTALRRPETAECAGRFGGPRIDHRRLTSAVVRRRSPGLTRAKATARHDDRTRRSSRRSFRSRDLGATRPASRSTWRQRVRLGDVGSGARPVPISSRHAARTEDAEPFRILSHRHWTTDGVFSIRARVHSATPLHHGCPTRSKRDRASTPPELPATSRSCPRHRVRAPDDGCRIRDSGLHVRACRRITWHSYGYRFEHDAGGRVLDGLRAQARRPEVTTSLASSATPTS